MSQLIDPVLQEKIVASLQRQAAKRRKPRKETESASSKDTTEKKASFPGLGKPGLVDRVGQFFNENKTVLPSMLVGAGLGGVTGGLLSARSKERPDETRGQRTRRILGDALMVAAMGAGAGGLGAYGVRQLQTPVPVAYQGNPMTESLSSVPARSIYAGLGVGGVTWAGAKGERLAALSDLERRTIDATQTLRASGIYDKHLDELKHVEDTVNRLSGVGEDVSRLNGQRQSLLREIFGSGSKSHVREAIAQHVRSGIEDSSQYESLLHAARIGENPWTPGVKGLKGHLPSLTKNLRMRLHPFLGNENPVTVGRLHPANWKRTLSAATLGFLAPEIFDAFVPGDNVDTTKSLLGGIAQATGQSTVPYNAWEAAQTLGEKLRN